MTEQEVCIGSLGQQKVYLNWSDVKDICTNAVSEAYEQARKENASLKELLKKHRDIFARTLALCIDLNFSEKQKNQFADDIAEIDQALGE